MNVADMNPAQQLEALYTLRSHPGWALYCASFEKDRIAIRDAAMEEPDDVKAAQLRAVWRKLDEFDPAKRRATLEKIAKNRMG